MPQRFCHSIGAVVRCNPNELGPGLPKDSASTSWTFPIAAISHKNVAKGVTFNEIQVMSWSFQQLFVGWMPCQRHDGKPFNATQCSILQNYVFLAHLGVELEVGVEFKLGVG